MGVVEFVFESEQFVIDIEEGLVINMDLMLLFRNLLVTQVYFPSVLLGEL